ncbi:MAG: peptidylprolyl isomerase [Anaerolineae bacterium]|nr:peptidylprolyl isomerase [Anaerolineae bacterium]
MTGTNLTVKDDLIVSLDYTLHLDGGQLVDSSSDGEPLEFLHGRGAIIPGLEQALYGMAVGEEKNVVVAPADGYGKRDPEALQVVPRHAFPPDLELEVGRMLHMRDSSTRQVFQTIVREIRPDDVLLDFNHPLAGETLHFHVQIAGVRAATGEELEHGHVHDGGHYH